MYHQQIARKKSLPLQSMATSNDITSSPGYRSLSAVVQRAQQDPLSVSGDERQQLESAIGTKSTREVLAGKQTAWVPEFQGISSQLWGNAPIQTKGKDDVGVSEVQLENKTGLPDNLKAGIENLSGMAMDDVRVHYNSSKPAEVEALAYTQGTNIHIASGQEKHLPHEAWHVVQQKQGRVKPTIQMKGVGINDDQGLEYEADVMGAVATEIDTYQLTHVVQQSASPTHQSIQRAKGKSRIPFAQTARKEVFGTDSERRKIPNDLTTDFKKEVKMTPVTVQSTDSNILEGFLYESTTLSYNNTTVLILSGSDGSSEQYTRPMAEKYTRMGARVVALNYRGYGQSHESNKKPGDGGTPTEKGLYEDAEAIYDHLIEGKGGLTPTAGNEIIVHGYSLGGPIAATLVKRILKKGGSVKGLVLDRAMSSTYEAAKANDTNALMAGGAKLAVGSFSVKEKLEKIKKIKDDLPIVITSAGSDNVSDRGVEVQPDKTDLDELFDKSKAKEIFDKLESKSTEESTKKDVLAAKDREIAEWAKDENMKVSHVEVPNATHLSQGKMMDALIPELIYLGLVNDLGHGKYLSSSKLNRMTAQELISIVKVLKDLPTLKTNLQHHRTNPTLCDIFTDIEAKIDLKFTQLQTVLERRIQTPIGGELKTLKIFLETEVLDPLITIAQLIGGPGNELFAKRDNIDDVKNKIKGWIREAGKGQRKDDLLALFNTINSAWSCWLCLSEI